MEEKGDYMNAAPHSEPESEIEEHGYRSRLIPLVIRHAPTLPVESKDQKWLQKHQRAPPWLDLLYDLVIVAVLTVFTVNHEITTAQSTLVYFSYFVIIWWVWASQILYDVRFEANDWIHRFFKFCQLGTFAFIGVTAQSFDPTNVVKRGATTPSGAAMEALGSSSWTGVATSYAASRLFVILQYCFVLWTTRRHKPHLPSLVVPPVAALVSAILWAVSAAMIGNANAKVACAYSALGLEIVASFVLPMLPGYMKLPSDVISERFGALSLIIIGEGIIGIIRSFSAVMAGFGFSRAAYAQCFCALVIISSLWHFLFHGMRNAATFENITHALDVVNDNLQTLFNDIDADDFTNTSASMEYLTVQFAKLSISPDWPDEVANVQAEYLNPNSTTDPVVDILQYEVQVYMAIANYYEVHLSEEVLEAAATINNLNTTQNIDSSTWNASYDHNVELANEFDQLYQTDLGHSVLFFLPSAGGFLFVLAILHLLRSLPIGAYMWWSWGAQVAGGIGLGFLGFLDLGDKTLTEDMPSPIPVYRLQQRSWMLPIVAITYAVLIFLDSILMVLAARHDRRRPIMPKADARTSSSPTEAYSVADAPVPFESPGETSSKVVQGSHYSLTIDHRTSDYS